MKTVEIDMNNITITKKWFSLKLLTVAFIFSALSFGMLYPHLSLPFTANDKVLHLAAFFIAGLALLGPLSVEGKVAFALLIVFSVILEFGQIFIQQREADLVDLGANFVGVFCAFCLWLIPVYFRRLSPRKRHALVPHKLRRQLRRHLRKQLPFGNRRQAA